MQHNSKTFFISLVITTLILVFSDILVSTCFPLIGLESFRISIVVLIVLYLCFYFNNILIAPLIAYFYMVHGIFSLEHWSVGALSCLLVSILISFLRNLIHLNNFFVTFVFVQVFQVLIFFLTRGMMYFKLDQGHFLSESSKFFVLESLIISLLSPLVFPLLHKIWFRGDKDIEEATA